jgi:GxxExxY protein
VHRELGSGFLEAVYHEAVMIEMEERGIPFLHEVELPLFYKGR